MCYLRRDWNYPKKDCKESRERKGKKNRKINKTSLVKVADVR